MLLIKAFFKFYMLIILCKYCLMKVDHSSQSKLYEYLQFHHMSVLYYNKTFHACAIFSVFANVTSHNLYYTRQHIFWDLRHNVLHIRDVLIAFWIHIDTYHCYIFAFKYNFYHQIHTCFHLKHASLMFLICLFLLSYK